jgi:hypothetical protein
MISVEEALKENKYEDAIDENVEKGVIHPRFLRWWQEDTSNDEPVNTGQDLIDRYQVCKSCEDFNNLIKLCNNCKCFMPVKVQFKKSKCPKGKW